MINKIKIDNYQVVTFDVFDTLIKRNTLIPSDALEYVEQKLVKIYGDEFSGFKKKRINAEKKIKEQKENHEYTLNEIYNFLFMDDFKLKKKVMEIEETVEKSLCVKNDAIYSLYEYCKKNAKKIFYVSDMYLSSDVIGEILTKCGYIVEKGQVFVSNEYGCNKKSGLLFKELINKNHLNPGCILHIGDSWFADYIGAKKNGIKAFHIPRHINNGLYSKSSLCKSCDERTLWASINNTLPRLDNYYEKIGCEMFSPIVIGFVTWIYKIAQEEKFDKLIFLARDAFLFYEGYYKIYDNTNISYAYISRKSLRLAYFYSSKNSEDVCCTFTTQKLTIDRILNEIGIDYEDYRDLIEKCSITSKEKFNLREKVLDERIMNFLNLLHEDRREKYLNAYRLTLQYLNDVGFLKKNVAVVDVGWHGSMQVMLASIIKLISPETKLTGLYYGCLSGTKKRLSCHKYRSYALTENNNIDEVSFMYFLERFISELIGSTKSYKNCNGKVCPVLENNLFGESEIKKIAEQIHRGCSKGIDSIINASVNVQNISGNYSYSSLIELIEHPKMYDAIQIGNIEFFDGIDYNMAKPDSLIKYFFYPSKFIVDLKKSRWREAFFLRLFKIPFPWGRIFVKVRSLYLKNKEFR